MTPKIRNDFQFFYLSFHGGFSEKLGGEKCRKDHSWAMNPGTVQFNVFAITHAFGGRNQTYFEEQSIGEIKDP